MSDAPASAVAQLNAQTAAAQQFAKSSSASRLWSHVVQRFPEIRNATQYYAYDVAKASKVAIEAAVSTVSSAIAAASPSDSIPSSDTNTPTTATKEVDAVESEVHYSPTPSSNVVGLSVRSIELQVVGGEHGGTFLMVILASIGRAIFEVCESGIYELYVNLSTSSDHIIGMRIVDRKKGFLVLTKDSVEHVSFVAGELIRRTSLKSGVIPQSLVTVGSTHMIITNRDFYQLIVMDIATLTEVAVLHADANLTTATSQTMVAFCSLPHDASSQTRYLAKKPVTSLESVARTVSSFSQILWGKSPQTTAQVQPLGSVSLFDVHGKEVIASFSPHNHVIASMVFNGDGTLLATASTTGTSINVFQVLREVINGGSEDSAAVPVTTVSLLARLSRGLTRAEIVGISFSPLNRYVVVATAVGTCHIFNMNECLPSRGRASADCQSEAALQINAFARIRSAPVGTPVLPRVAFSPLTSDDTQSCLLSIGSIFGVVTTVRCSPTGVSTVYSCYLDQFKMARETLLDEIASAPLECNAQIELETFERYSPLEAFCFQQSAEGESRAPCDSPGPAANDWDECPEVVTQGDGATRDLSAPFSDE